MAKTSALARLFRDNDPETMRLVRTELTSQGEEAIPELESLAAMDDENVSFIAREILGEISCRQVENDFGLFCQFFPEEGCLEVACWSLAAALMPGGDFARFQFKIKQWGRQFLILSSGAISSRERVKLLAQFVSSDLGFRGNTDHYYNERNSLLPSVIETRMGIPITLCAIYLFIAHRAGMRVTGINLPGHFIARHGDVFFDPFHRGRILTQADCEQILRCQQIDPQPQHFSPATSRQILQRMLVNLLYAYDLKPDAENHAKVKGWIQALRREE